MTYNYVDLECMRSDHGGITCIRENVMPGDGCLPSPLPCACFRKIVARHGTVGAVMGGCSFDLVAGSVLPNLVMPVDA